MLTFRIKKQALDVIIEHYINTGKVMKLNEFREVWFKMGNASDSNFRLSLKQFEILRPEIDEYIDFCERW